jgi:hypothetical protein
MKHKRRRKEPRRKTPPLLLRSDDDQREIVEVDQEFTTTEKMRSGRVRAFLVLSPGLKITVGSRCVNKRRVPVLRIYAHDWQPPPDNAGETFRQLRDGQSFVELESKSFVDLESK